MNQTVDLVVAGAGRRLLAAADAALRLGQRVLIVVRPGHAGVARRLRRHLRGAAPRDDGRLTVVTNAEVVCVDGIAGVEAVVIRDAGTGRLRAVNASAFLCHRPKATPIPSKTAPCPRP